jgi:YggT family protein
MDDLETRRVVQANIPEEHEESVEVGAGGLRRERTVRTARGDEDREIVFEDLEGRRYLWAAKVTQVVWLLITIIEVFIGLRVLLRVLAAGPDSPFTNLVYNMSAVFLAPFFGVVGSPAAGGSVLEVPSIIAMLVYLLIGWLFVQAIWIALDRPSTGGVSRYHRFLH